MIKNKLYPCEIPDCSNLSIVRSRIKNGEFKGLKACPYHKSIYDKQISRQTTNNKEKRKLERKGLPDFFETKISELKRKPFCENCGVKIKWWLFPVNNVAHILPKSKYKSVNSNLNNYLFLCDSKDNDEGSSCHREFDSGLKFTEMKVFNLALSRYKLFRDDVLEVGKEKLFFEEYVH